jgi:hypothetical protein
VTALDHPNTSEKVTILLMSAFFFWIAYRGLRTGAVIPVIYVKEAKRSEEPGLFWISVLLYILFGVVCIWWAFS